MQTAVEERRRAPPAAPTRGVADVEALIAALERCFGARIAGRSVVEARPARYADMPAALDARLRTALEARGVARLYSHQREAWDCLRAGRHAVMVTPTASGKTLCYNLPVLQSVLSERAKALYLFPTKALSQDQVAEIVALDAAGALGVRACTFDGDTPGDARKAVRTRGDVVVSNPDMLHQGILPHHTKWAQFFECLRYVVIDEMHTYRGVFGAHMVNVLRRLRRICRFYGSDPVFALCSATIANPGELASRLVESDVEVIDRSGAPRGEKTILLWNPPMVNAPLGLRASARSQTTRIARMAVKAGLKCILFAQTRTMVEVLTKYMKDTFDNDPRKPARVRAYRGGYLPTERRETEKKLRSGRVDCVVATSALELGVDIGALDACVLNGYPGTIAGTWQRFGRAGRRNRASLGVLVASSLPLDQFMVRHPEFFFGASPEHARVDPDQLLILMDHVRCAAFELPFSDGERLGRAEVGALLECLEDEQVLHREAGRWHWMADSYPANTVGLRSVAEGSFVVVDITDGAKRVIAEVDFSSAPMTLYEGAIYMLQARPWQVESLDWEGRKAYVRATNADYYTEAIDYTRLKVLESFETDIGASSRTAHGEVHLVRRVAGYKKIRYYSHENVGYGNVNLPDHELHTTAVWWNLPAGVLEARFESRWQALEGFLGAAHAMHFVAAMLSMSEHGDLGRAVGASDATWFGTVGACGRGEMLTPSGEAFDPDADNARFQPTVFLYDNYPGGIGLSAPLFEMRTRVVAQAARMVASCPCSDGCPACIGPVTDADADTDTDTDSRGDASRKALAQGVLALFAEPSSACT